MKQNILVLVLMLASVFVAFPSVSSDVLIRADSRSNQYDAKKTEHPKVVYDIYGKRFRSDEKYIASRTLKNGRIIAYRKNRQEIAALIKVLKQAGVTEKKVLNPEFWAAMICYRTLVKDGCPGGCGSQHTCTILADLMSRPGDWGGWIYCDCIGK